MANAPGNVIIGLSGASVFSIGSTPTPVGYLEEKSGVALRVEREYVDKRVGQEVVTIGKTLTSKKAFITARVAEASLANLVHAFDNVALSGSTLTVGSDAEGEVALSFVGVGPDGSARTVAVPKAVSIGNGETTYVENGQVVVPLEYEAIGDPSASGKLLTIVDA